MACYIKTKENEMNMKSQYGEGLTIPDGLLADKNSAPTSIFTFGIIMAIGAFISLYALNQRKTKILTEAYSKLSIFKKK